MVSRKALIISLCAALVVAGAVAAAVILVQKNSSKPHNNNNNASQKAIQELCKNTNYPQTCIDTLSTNSSDAKDLIKSGFNIAINELNNVVKESEPLQKASKDPNTAEAYGTCRKLLEDSVADLRKATDSFESFNLKTFIDDAKTWLTGALTSLDTCVDLFEDSNSEDGSKMARFVNVTREITINGFALVDEFSKLMPRNEPGPARRLGSQFPWPDHDDARIRRLLYGPREAVEPNVVVAKDGSGKYKTINEALREVPVKSNETFVIYVKEGVYKEYVVIDLNMWSVVLIGDGPRKTRITGWKSKKGGFQTFWTATVRVEGDNFIARDIGFENSAGPHMHQAVALLVASDKSIFFNCHMDGHQDTLCVHNHRQFYRECTISGTIDFIFGNARAVFQNCDLLVKKPLDEQRECMVTAQGRTAKEETSAIVIQNCRIKPAPDYPIDDESYSSYLGRPWKEYSRTIIMHSELDSIIDPRGWAPWNDTSAHLDSCWYAEVRNRGLGARLRHRVKWGGIKRISIREAQRYTPGEFMVGDEWIAGKGIPYVGGLIKDIL